MISLQITLNGLNSRNLVWRMPKMHFCFHSRSVEDCAPVPTRLNARFILRPSLTLMPNGRKTSVLTPLNAKEPYYVGEGFSGTLDALNRAVANALF